MQHTIGRIEYAMAFITPKYGEPVGTRNSSVAPSRGINPTIHRTTSRRSTTELRLAPFINHEDSRCGNLPWVVMPRLHESGPF